MNKLITIFLIYSICPFVFADDTATKNDLVFIPSIAFLEKSLRFQQEESGTVSGSGEFTAKIPMLDVSLTIGYSKFFLTLKYDHDFTEVNVDTSETKTVSGSGSYQYFWQPPGTEMPVGREDKNITLGYNVIDGLSVFVGYMEGETTITPPPTCENPTILGPGTPTPISCTHYNFAWLRLRQHLTFTPTDPFEDYEQTYQEKGPYIGFSYAIPIADRGTLSLSAAYAEMDGNFRDNLIGTGFDATGNVYGSSLGITWIEPLTERTAYFIDLRRQSYKMTSTDDNITAKFDTEETMNGLSLGMQFYF